MLYRNYRIPKPSATGGYVVMKAEIDLVVIVTACSSKRVNGVESTPISVEMID